MIENTEELQGQLIASGNVVASMISQKGAKGDKGDKGDTGTPGTDGTDGFSPIITTEKQGKVTTLTIIDAEGTKTATILDGNDGSGTGDMLKATYDQNNNGIVDNAEKVNNHTVAVDVPADAVFTDTTYIAGTNVSISAGNVISATDTTYTAGTGIEITAGNVINNTQTSAEWGNISGTLADQTDLKNALDSKGTYSKPSGGIPKTDLTSAVQTSLGKADTAIQSSDLSTVATTGDYDDLIDKPTIPPEMSILSYGSSTWNDFITAYTTNSVVYCKTGTSSNPATAPLSRMAILTYVRIENNEITYVEFQYYRSIASHSSSQQGDQVFVYTLDKTNGWSFETREAASKVVAGNNMTSSYSGGVLTLNAEAESIPVQDTAPQDPEEDDLWIDTSEPEEMQEAIVNEYSESTSNTYSCDYVNDNYRTNAQNDFIQIFSGTTAEGNASQINTTWSALGKFKYLIVELYKSGTNAKTTCIMPYFLFSTGSDLNTNKINRNMFCIFILDNTTKYIHLIPQSNIGANTIQFDSYGNDTVIDAIYVQY